jgi:lactate permease
VCYGGLGTPVFVLAQVTDLPGDAISTMCGHQLPFLSCLVPFYMVKVMCSWRQTFEVWPALAVGGGSFALFQYFFATMHNWTGVALWPLTDVGGAIFSMLTLAVFLKYVWKPKNEWKFPASTDPALVDPPALEAPTDAHAIEAQMKVKEMLGDSASHDERPLTPGLILKAWSPFIIMSLCLGVVGWLRQVEKPGPIDLGITQSYYPIPVPGLHMEVERADRLQKPGAVGDARLEKAVFEFKWLTAAGTPCVVAALISALVLRTPRRVLRQTFVKTMHNMKIPIPTIACMLGLSYVTKYAGMDATLGVAFAGTGLLYPFFAAILGWTGVFLTGTDAGSNALFGSLQKITATEIWNAHHTGALSNLTLEQTQVLICTANSTGGVMGKMIDAQSICVATAGTNQVGKEGEIFKAVIWHSIALACIVGAIVCVQAFVPPFTAMVPQP